jgi:ribonucleoside-diphosphate reductase beta chain
MTRLQFQEVNHSDTYSYILRNIFDNPEEIFDTILTEKTITKHTINTMQPYEDFYTALADWETKGCSDSGVPVMKKHLWKSLIAWNIIEGIRFFVSFACTFAFAENKKMTGNAQELKLIARDEILHLQMTQKLINILKTKEEEGFFEIIEECKDEVTQMFANAARDEIEWAEELFKEGSIIGLNANILSLYMKHITNVRLRAIKEPKMFTEVTQNPLPWMDQWLGQGREEVLPQEVEITDYKIGIMSDMEDDEWDELYE